jgi:acetoin utilization deacetylase AcuC-like enzyme
MTLLYRRTAFQQHLTGGHPEHPRRCAAIDEHLSATGLASRCRQPDWTPASPANLAKLHDPAYVAAIREYAAAGGDASRRTPCLASDRLTLPVWPQELFAMGCGLS